MRYVTAIVRFPPRHTGTLRGGSRHRRSARLQRLLRQTAAAVTPHPTASTASTTAEQVADSPITVWVDAAREPAVTAFKEANPDVADRVRDLRRQRRRQRVVPEQDHPHGPGRRRLARRRLLDAAERRDLGVEGDPERRAGLRGTAEQGLPRPGLPRRIRARARTTSRPSTARSTACATTSPRRCSTTTSRCSTSSATTFRPRGRSTANSATSWQPSTPATSSAAWATRS